MACQNQRWYLLEQDESSALWCLLLKEVNFKFLLMLWNVFQILEIVTFFCGNNSLKRRHIRIHFGSVFHWQFFITNIFSVSWKFGACYITEQWGRVQSEECYSMFAYIFCYFLFVLFLTEKLFLSYWFLFLMKYQICAWQCN